MDGLLDKENVLMTAILDNGIFHIIQLDEAARRHWRAGEADAKHDSRLSNSCHACSSPGAITRCDVHTAVAELIKGIILMATPTPGAGLAELHTGPASIRFGREIVCAYTVGTLTEYIFA
ncbi:hypothetical protein C8F04DRAFT_1252607 [Mycena alexandri]|uniref:Uncharacterized protein n=1 Tax=Mycena alexandri TaxID=1745969 RepID=A0AAD6XB90_9AGAR|nr:hypothetical protein C8F04DRAFT_1252607 [Mycena alexandri]